MQYYNKTVDNKKNCRTHEMLKTPEPMNTYYVNSQLDTNLIFVNLSHLKGRLTSEMTVDQPPQCSKFPFLEKYGCFWLPCGW